MYIMMIEVIVQLCRRLRTVGTRFQVELHSSLKTFFNYEINNSIGTYNLFLTLRKIWIGLVFIYIKFPFMTLRHHNSFRAEKKCWAISHVLQVWFHDLLLFIRLFSSWTQLNYCSLIIPAQLAEFLCLGIVSLWCRS